MSGEIGGPLSLCWLGFHRWRRWGAPEEITVVRRGAVTVGGYMYSSSEPPSWTEEWQSRECEECGAIQKREVKAP